MEDIMWLIPQFTLAFWFVNFKLVLWTFYISLWRLIDMLEMQDHVSN